MSSNDVAAGPPTTGRVPSVLIVQHGDEDPPMRLGGWLTEAGCSWHVVRAHHGEELPASLVSYEALVVLGGAMGAYDDAEFPWLTATKELLREAARRDLPTLGICLGHQLLAVANGGRVVVADASQAGVTAVCRTSAAQTDPLFDGLGADPVAVHWNNDVVVNTPPGAVVLSRSTGGVQAIRLGTRVWGLQFHPEVEPETAALWAAGDVRSGRLTAADAAARVVDIRDADARLQRTWRAFALRFAALIPAP